MENINKFSLYDENEESITSDITYFKIETDKIKRPKDEIREYQELLSVAYENLYRLNVSESAIIMQQIRNKVNVPKLNKTQI